MGGRGANSSLRKEKATQINKSIKSLNKRIIEHQNKIDDLKASVSSIDMLTIEQKGLIKHWEKEISTFKTNIQKAKDEKKKLR